MKQERNAKCACGSGQKYKKCCLLTERENARLAEIEWKARMAQRAEEKRLARELLIGQAKGHGGPASVGVGNRHGRSFMMAALAMSAPYGRTQTPAPAPYKP